MMSRRTSGIVLACCGWAVMVPAQAAWVIEPSAQLATSYEDNVRMDPIVEDDAVVTTATAQARVANVTERSQISGIGGLSYVWYSGADDLEDRDNWFFTLSGDRQYERFTMGIAANARRDVVLRRVDEIPGDFEPGDPVGGEVPGGDLGGDPGLGGDDIETDIDENIVRDQVERTNLSVSPYFSYSMNERTRLRLGYAYYGLRYEDDPSANLQDSDTNSLFALIDRDLSPRDTVRLRAQASRFEPETSLETENYQLTVGWRRRATERFSFGIDVGGRQLETDINDDAGWVLHADATYQTERGRFTGSIEHSVVPSAYGNVVEADRVNLAYIRQLGERAGFRLSARAYNTDGESGNRDRQFFGVSPRLDWSLSPAWALSLGYEYRWTERDEDPDSAQGNAATLAIVYRPPSPL